MVYPPATSEAGARRPFIIKLEQFKEASSKPAQLKAFSTVGFFFAPNFIQNLYTVLKKRLWESRSTPTLEEIQ
jgi:hypothetical protein